MSATDFTVGDVSFRLEPLKLKEQLKGEAIVVGALLPAIVAFANGANVTSSVIADVLKGIERVDELFELFAARCQVNWQGKGFVPLAAFQDNVFERRGDLLFGFIAEAVFAEFGCFLDERGKSVITKAAERFAFLLG